MRVRVLLYLDAAVSDVTLNIAEMAAVAAADDRGRWCDSRRMSACRVLLLLPVLPSTDTRAITICRDE
jgi:hypothetical protein